MTTDLRRDLLLAVAVTIAVVGALAAMRVAFLDDAWIVPGGVAVLASIALAAGARAAQLPALASLVLSLLGFASVGSVLLLPAGGLVPGREELVAALELGRAGITALEQQAAPAEALPELVLLVATGAWWVTFVVHEVAVRLRHAGLALVPAAGLWIVPLAMPQPGDPGIGAIVPFLLGAALVLLLEADADLAGWVRDRLAPRVSVMGVAVAVFAVGLGVVAPFLLPGYDEPPVLDLGDGRQPRGYQPIVDVGDRLSLPVDRPVLRVRTDRRVYLRLAALDTYDENTWRIGPPGSSSFTPDEAELFSADGELPFEVPIAEVDPTVVDVEVLDLENIYVPTPYQPSEVRGPAADDMVWSRVGGFLATGEVAENELGGTLRTGVVPGFEYQVVAAIPDPTIEQLRAAEPDPGEIAPLLQLPGPASRWQPYGELADSVYEQAGAASTVDRVLALQDWFTDDGGFTYSLDDVDPLRGTTALDTFLFDTQTGYCEYFSTAMAVMLRASGIPARTAVGFLPGDRIADPAPGAADQRATYQVSTGDAHAWVEVLFPGQGWITFDPTPRSDGATLTPDAANLTPDTPVAERTDEPTEAPSPDASPTDDQSVGDTPADADVPLPQTPDLADAGTDDGGSTGSVPVPLLVVLVVLAGGAAAVLLRRTRALSAGAGAAAALEAQRRVLREAARLGIPRGQAETTPEALHRWAAEGRVDPTDAAAFLVIVQAAAFGRIDAAVDGQRATDLGAALVTSLRTSATTGDRVVAPVRGPASNVTAASRRALAAGRDLLTR